VINKIISKLLSKTENYNYKIDKTLFEKFINKIKIYDTGHDLIRLGNQKDGGYLIPNIIENIHLCFSAGVGEDITFEQELKKKNIKCFLADGTVEAPNGFNFLKKNINIYNDKYNIDINTWLNSNFENLNDLNTILKLDVEGSEIGIIYNIDEKILSKVNILIVEFHDFLYLGNHFSNRIYNEVFNKILKYFTICHIHPNNFGSTKYINNINMPSLLEFTFINNVLLKTKNKTQKIIPHPLDRKNNPLKKDITLPNCFYG
tara:strand:- start:450 stop:1229 length:780 start_codon:yes stop_codon:yes gene_type:complete